MRKADVVYFRTYIWAREPFFKGVLNLNTMLAGEMNKWVFCIRKTNVKSVKYFLSKL